MKKIFLLSTLCLLAIMSSCRDDNDNDIIGSNNSNVTEGSDQELSGFYLLNEGQWGANNSTLDYFDVKTGIYSSNIYAERNPNVIKELGDTGNDLKIYNGRLYAVMNGSHKVEIMTADSAKHIAEVDIPNGRFICFDGNYAYVSSYVGASWGNGEVLGAVYKLDTQTATVVDSVLVGYQPEELAVVDSTLYVTNSGGLHTGYDNTVSVIDLDHFTVTGEITVGINPFRVKADNKGHLYVSSQGNYFDIPANLYVIDTQSNHVVDTLNIGASDFCIVGDTAYAYSSEWSNTTNAYTYTYHTIDLNTREVSPATFVTDGTPITSLYGMAVNPDTKEVYLTDAGDYTNSGTIFCFNPDGTLKWKADTGVSPAHFALKY